jgi:hypothetical protein
VRKLLSFSILLIASLACALPGISAPAAAPLPTFDSNSVEIIIAETAAAAQTQTALKIPTATNTPKPTHTPSITPTFTPTFLFFLPTLTPIPTYTVPVTVSAGDIATPSGDDEDDEEGGKEEKRDPRKMTGKEWTCTVLGTYPPRNSVFGPNVRFNVKWTLFNSGTKDWPYLGVDLVYTGGLRHEGTKIQDFNRSVPSGGEIQVGAVFITPKKAGEHSTFFTLQVGKREFCHMVFYFTVEE